MRGCARVWRRPCARRKAIRVTFRPSAQSDLDDLFDYLRAEVGPRTAARYVDRLLDICLSLSQFPHRGAPRPALAPGARLLGFEKRTSIVYRVGEDVEILRVIYGGRDAATLFANEE